MDLGIKVLVFSGFFYFLSNCRGDFTNLNVFETIDIESNIKNFSELSLSQFNAEIKYIPLKNDNNQEISWIDHLDFSSDFLLVSNTNACLLYDYNGTIIKKIGGKGRGPDEFVTISNAGFGFSKNIYIQSLGNFLEFKTDGTFVSSFDIKKGKDPSLWVTAKELKDHVASDDFKNNVPEYREKKKKLEDLTNKLTEFDNPVLIFVTFKKRNFDSK